MNIYDDTPETAPPYPKPVRPRKPKALADQIRSGRPYKEARARFLLQAQNHRNPDGTRGEPCWICGEPIDYRLKYPHPKSFSIDHMLSARDRPDLIMVQQNWRSAHMGCNAYRGTGEPPIDLGVPSEAW
jgi:hypothetical protein